MPALDSNNSFDLRNINRTDYYFQHTHRNKTSDTFIVTGFEFTPFTTSLDVTPGNARPFYFSKQNKVICWFQRTPNNKIGLFYYGLDKQNEDPLYQPTDSYLKHCITVFDDKYGPLFKSPLADSQLIDFDPKIHSYRDIVYSVHKKKIYILTAMPSGTLYVTAVTLEGKIDDVISVNLFETDYYQEVYLDLYNNGKSMLIKGRIITDKENVLDRQIEIAL